jgi:hypothetical protein
MGQRETSGKHGKPLSKEGDVSGDRRHRVVDFCVGMLSCYVIVLLPIFILSPRTVSECIKAKSSIREI